MSALDDMLRARGMTPAKPSPVAATKPTKRLGAITPTEAKHIAIPGGPRETPTVHDVIQGTPEWSLLRAGIPTASSFDRIVTPGGGKSRSAEKYCFLLVAERLIGHPVATFKSLPMQKGSQREIECVQFYELQRDLDTVPCGFMTIRDGKIGASPDRLVEDSGLLEAKCPNEETHMGYLLQSGTAYEEYKVQCQGQLWVSGRDWVDVVSYHPELPMALGRTERDDSFIEILKNEVGKFSVNLEALVAECIERGWQAKPIERKMNDPELDRKFKEWSEKGMMA